MVVLYRSACDSTTPLHQLNQPLRTPLPLNRVTETHREAPQSIQDAVSYRTRPAFASLLLSSFNGNNSPFIRTTSEAVVTIGSQFSQSNSM